MSRLVVASAAKFETDELVRNLRENGVQATQLIVGIGFTQSALIAARLRELIYQRDVVFVCTGGLLGEFRRVEVYQAKAIRLQPVDIRHGYSYLVPGCEPNIELGSLPLELPHCLVSGSLSISLRPESAKKDQPDLETLELYSVARAWSSCAKTFTGIVASTNAVGPDAHIQWKSNFQTAASMTADVVSRSLLKMKDRWE